MAKPLDKQLYDYTGKVIPHDKIDEYYQKGIMDIQSMREYETFKGELIKENEKASKHKKSAEDLIFQEKDKMLFSISKSKPKSDSA